MNNHQAKLFLEVVNDKSLSSVAKKHGTSYQKIAYYINTLEREFNVKLFNRGKLGCTLTAAGKQFKTFVENYLSDYDQVKEKMFSISNNLVFGVDISFLNPISSHVATIFNDKNLTIYSSNYEDLYEALKNDIISCYFGHEKEWDKSINFEPIYQDQLCIVTSNKNALCKKINMTYSELNNFKIDLSNSKSILSEIPTSYLSKNNTIITNSTRSAYDHFLINGQTITISPLLYKALCLPSICFIPIKDAFITYGLFYRYKSKKIDELIKVYKETANYFSMTDSL